MKIARAAFLQAEQLQTAIGDRRRALFTQALFAAGPSVLSPDMWGNALSTVPEDLRASGYIFGGWLSGFSDAMSSVRGGLILLAFGGALLLYYLRRRYLPRFKARFSMEGRWQFSLGAKVQGETGTVDNKLVITAQK